MTHRLLSLALAALFAALLGIVFVLRLPEPAAAVGPHAAGDVPAMFQTAGVCMGCHNGMITPSGEDISMGSDWRASMMANSARDPYWQAAVRREVTDHPSARAAIEDECSTCHMPMARYRAHVTGGRGQVFAHLPVRAAMTHMDRLAADGVSCTTCHQITSDGFGTRESFVGGFVIDTVTAAPDRSIFGPFRVDAGRQTVMRSAARFTPTQSEHLQRSQLCATCHTLYTHTLGPGGEVIGELPEQVPYLEWEHSAYAREGQSCQSCHMPEVADSVAVASVMGPRRAGASRHVFRGGNFFMLRMLNRHAGELGVEALPQELTTAAARTVEHLRTATARLALEAIRLEQGRLVADVVVENRAGHKLPTAYPSRRSWLHLTVRDRHGTVVFESGALEATGAVAGNDNDRDARRYEPHHTLITRPDQVQVYEAIMADPEGRVTTGLLTAVHYVKDNRLLPRGFDKRTAGADVAVQGAAAADDDFADGGDRVRYAVDVAVTDGPFQVEAELLYQPIAYRWAHNLAAYDTEETQRFVDYYRGMSGATATRLAAVTARTE